MRPAAIAKSPYGGSTLLPHHHHRYHHHHHLSLNRVGRWGTTDDFATSILHISLFSTAFWDLANSRPVHSIVFPPLPLSASSSSPFTVPCQMVLARPDERETRQYNTTAFAFLYDGQEVFVWSSCLCALQCVKTQELTNQPNNNTQPTISLIPLTFVLCGLKLKTVSWQYCDTSIER